MVESDRSGGYQRKRRPRYDLNIRRQDWRGGLTLEARGRWWSAEGGGLVQRQGWVLDRRNFLLREGHLPPLPVGISFSHRGKEFLWPHAGLHNS